MAAVVVLAEEYRGPFPIGHPVEMRASLALPSGVSKARIINMSDNLVALDVRIADWGMGPLVIRNPIDSNITSLIEPLGAGPKWVAGAPMPTPVTELALRRDEYIGLNVAIPEQEWFDKLRINLLRADTEAIWTLGYSVRLAHSDAKNRLVYQQPLLSSNRIVLNPDDVRAMVKAVKRKPVPKVTPEDMRDVDRFRLTTEFDNEVVGRLYLDVICESPKELHVERRQWVPEGMYIDLRTIEAAAFAWVIEANGKELARGSMDVANHGETDQSKEAGDDRPAPADTARPVFLQRGQIVGRMVNIPGTPTIVRRLQTFFADEPGDDATCTLTFTATCRIPTGPIETPTAGEPIVGTLTAEPLTITRQIYERMIMGG